MSDYTIEAYLAMMRDPLRKPAYEAAIPRVVREGDVVVDLGAGPGWMTFLALRAGASHVYAIDQAEAVTLIERVAAANGLADRVTVFHGDSRRVELPRPADVLLSDIRGVMPIIADSVHVIADARRRLLAPGGRMMPLRDVVSFAPVQYDDGYAAVDGWRDPELGADYAAVATLASHQWTGARMPADCALAPAAALPAVDYADLASPAYAGEASFRVERAGTVHGIGAWFRAELVDDVAIDTAPGGAESVYQHAYFPIARALPVAAGDVVQARLAVDARPARPVWRWSVGDEDHSTLDAEIDLLASLRKRADSHAPQLDRDGAVLRFILERMDGNTSLGAVATALVDAFPGEFRDHATALARVGDVSVRYSA